MAPMAPDQLARGTAYDGQIRIFAAVSTGLVQELQQRHQLWPVASAALGRTVTVTAMMGLMQDEGKVTVQIKGDGPLGQMVADADAAGHAPHVVGAQVGRHAADRCARHVVLISHLRSSRDMPQTLVQNIPQGN